MQSLSLTLLAMLGMTMASPNSCGKATDGPVLGGVDVVYSRDYYDDNGEVTTPVVGSSDYVYKYQGFEFYFTDSTNLNKFTSNLEYYLPEFGGYCPWALSGHDEKAGKRTYALGSACIGDSSQVFGGFYLFILILVN